MKSISFSNTFKLTYQFTDMYFLNVISRPTPQKKSDMLVYIYIHNYLIMYLKHSEFLSFSSVFRPEFKNFKSLIFCFNSYSIFFNMLFFLIFFWGGRGREGGYIRYNNVLDLSYRVHFLRKVNWKSHDDSYY